MKTIPLTKGYFTKVDDEDYESTAIHRWYADVKKNGVYAKRRFSFGNGKSKIVALHRIITNVPAKKHIDHINGDSLDNRKSNLRLCSNAENSRNRKKSRKNVSGYKGVYWSSQKKKWHAEIWKDYRKYHLGFFDNLIDAVLAYNEGALRLHGGFAKLNKLPNE
jgi:hypothetical protein